MPAVAEVILILLFVQGKRNQEALEAKNIKIKGSSINKQTQNSNKRCIVVATGELGALEKQKKRRKEEEEGGRGVGGFLTVVHHNCCTHY